MVIPCYNEEKLIGRVIESMPDMVDRIFVVDDKSPDDTVRVVSEYAAANPDRIKLIERANVAARNIDDDVDYRDHTHVRKLDEPYPLAPGTTIHGITRERITLPDNLCGFLEGRSRFARLGLQIHVTSAFVQPGVSNRQVLEMSNVSGRTLQIRAGVRICQLVLLRTEGQAVYHGRFAEQQDL